MLQTVTTIRDLRVTLLPWREAGETVALVPTMGALHKGHLALIETARRLARHAVASVFVNSLQFGPNEDFAKYPRRLEDDKKLLTAAGCDLLYAPAAAAVYPAGFAAGIDPGPLGTVLEGAFRPGHFAGVATVVAKLLLQAMPDTAVFGEKDYQQLLVIHRVVRDLDIPVRIVGVPIVREADGLALSSRNAYLTPEQRPRAALLSVVLNESAAQIRAGKSITDVLKKGSLKLAQAGFAVDYLELADAATLEPLREFKPPARLLVAARLGATRLIDNMAV